MICWLKVRVGLSVWKKDILLAIFMVIRRMVSFRTRNDLQAYLDQNCKGNAANSKQGASIKPGDLKFVDVDGMG